MARKPPSLLQLLLNLLLKYLPEQPSALSTKLVVGAQCPLPADHDTWHAYWKVQGQPWRTEPEIDEKRQEELSKRRAIVPDLEQGIYPFKGMKLSRADIEWLLVTHDDGRGPVDWQDESQRRRRGVDLRGADLRDTDLSKLPLSRMRGGVTSQERRMTTLHQAVLAAVHLERVNLFQTHLEGAVLRNVHLEGAYLEQIHLEGADCGNISFENVYLAKAHLGGTYLRRASFNKGTFLNDISLGDERTGFIAPVDVTWDGVNLSVVQWNQMSMLGHERWARQRRTEEGEVKDNITRLNEYEVAVRANRQLSIELQLQGINEEAARFAYRAQVLQRRVLWFQILQSEAKLRQRLQALSAWLFSWFLFLIAGYGYRPGRSFLAYLLVISGFATAYYLLGHISVVC